MLKRARMTTRRLGQVTMVCGSLGALGGILSLLGYLIDHDSVAPAAPVGALGCGAFLFFSGYRLVKQSPAR